MSSFIIEGSDSDAFSGRLRATNATRRWAPAAT
jgi:hypothetical protein